MITDYDRVVSDLGAAISRNSALCDERDKAIRERDEALADNERLRALLREVEWLEGFDSDGDEVIECPLCHAQQSSYGKYRSHTSDCHLAAALEGR